MSCAVESGLRPGRLEWVRETTFGVAPTDPVWALFSDSVQSISFDPAATITPRRQIGNVDIQDFNAGAEDHTFEITYDLDQWLDSGAALDAHTRQANGCLYSHTIVYRETLGDGQLNGRRVYYVAEGCKINSMRLTGEPESGDPMMVTLSYMCQKIRSYVVDMPNSDQLSIVSSDNADTMNITIEDDGASTAETFALTGITPVTTTAIDFTSIDAIRLASQPKGDITISVVGGGAETLCVIYGSDSYDTRAGDLGIPALGSGSHGSAIGGTFENLLGDTIERPTSTDFLTGSNGITSTVDISSVEMAVENGLEATATHKSIGKRINEGTRTITIGTNIFGEKAAYEAMTEHLRKTEVNLVWTLTGGTLTFVGSVLTGLGGIALESEQAVLSTDHTFTAKSLTVA